MQGLRFLTSTLLVLSFIYAEPATQSYPEVVIERNVMIPKRDGVRLATDIYRPARAGSPVAGKLPVLFQRTPYDKSSGGLHAQAQLFARHGYVVALQDCRGRYKSEGLFSKSVSRAVEEAKSLTVTGPTTSTSSVHVRCTARGEVPRAM
jgi:hypothetical protein